MATRKKKADPGLDRHWHLARNGVEVGLTELEFAIFRAGAALDRWQGEALTCCAGAGLGAAENAVLHVVRMHERPKGISEIARLLNRDDTANLQYTVRKLLRTGLIRRAGSGGSKRDATYEVTEEGERVTDLFARYRSELLVTLLLNITELEIKSADATRVLNLLSGIYDQASRVVASHRT